MKYLIMLFILCGCNVRVKFDTCKIPEQILLVCTGQTLYGNFYGIMVPSGWTASNVNACGNIESGTLTYQVNPELACVLNIENGEVQSTTFEPIVTVPTIP